MPPSEKFRNHCKEIILNVLSDTKSSLLLLELKKKTALANLYFFDGLKVLEEQGYIQKTTVDGKTRVSLRQ